MKKLILVIIVSVLTISQTAHGKIINNEMPEVLAKPQTSCYAQSNANYNRCMFSCVSTQSPQYIVEMCFNKCIPLINYSYFRCLQTGKYKELRPTVNYGTVEINYE